MTDQRIKGLEVTVLITRATALEDTLTDIQNLDIEPMFEIKSMGYLGEKTERKDEIYKGVKFKMDLHLHSQDYWRFVNAIKDRAMRNTPDVVFNISGVFQFPNGQTPSILIEDAKFGANPLNVSSRGDYVKATLQGEAGDFTVSFS